MTTEQEYPKIPLNYGRDLVIDQNSLELEWLSIAKQIMAYSEAHVQAQFNRDRTKQKRDVAEAELDRVARSEPIPEDLPISAKTGQPTEAAVLNWIHKQDRYQEAQKERQEAEYVVNMLQAAVFAFQAKKTALENLVRLFGMKYYAEPYDQAGSDIKPRALEQGRLAATAALRENAAVNKTPTPDRDKDGHRYAVSAGSRGMFIAGPFPELQQALDCSGQVGQGIYRLTREQPDELIYVWISEPDKFGWDKVSCATPGTSNLPPRPPQRPLPKR